MSDVMPLYGCRLLEVDELDPDADFAPLGDPTLLEVPQEAGVEPDIIEGARDELRGGDRLVAVIEEEDYLAGLNITFNNAELDPTTIQIIAGGGDLIEDEEEVPNVIGYESPTFDDQHDGRVPFQAKLYVAQYTEGFSEREELTGFIEFTFPYCKGQIPSVSPAGQTFMVPSFTIEAREHKHSDPKQGAFKFKQVAVGDLPSV